MESCDVDKGVLTIPAAMLVSVDLPTKNLLQFWSCYARWETVLWSFNGPSEFSRPLIAQDWVEGLCMLFLIHKPQDYLGERGQHAWEGK